MPTKKTITSSLRRGKRKTIKGGLKSKGGSKSKGRSKCGFEDIEIKPNFKYYNKMHKTCIPTNNVDNDISYITTRHFFRQNIESIIISKFDISLSNNPQILSRKIMIEDKYVGCFLKIRNEWYAIMRLLGTTFNVGAFAQTEKHRVYFKFKPNIIKVYNNGLIHFPQNESYQEKDSDIIKIKDDYIENITIHQNQSNDELFMILDIFRFDFRHIYT
jgi:hypothetical protein